MIKVFRQFLFVCVILLLSVQRMPAPFEIVPDDAPKTESAPKKKKKRVVHTEKAASESTPRPTPAATPTPAAETDAQPAEESPATPQTDTSSSGTGLELLSKHFEKTVQLPDNGEITYIVTASNDLNSSATRQEIRFIIKTRTVTTGPTKILTNNAYRKTSIFSGKTKSLAQITEVIRQAFRRGASGSAAPGQVLGQIGDARYGGKIKFVAESDALRFDYYPQTRSTFRLERADVEHFLEVMPP